MENTVRLLADLALSYTPKTAMQLLAEFVFPADRPPYLPDLNSLDFSIMRLQAKVQAMPFSILAALHLSTAME